MPAKKFGTPSTPTQRRVLKRMAEGWKLTDYLSKRGGALLESSGKWTKVGSQTVAALATDGWIETDHFEWPIRTYKIARLPSK